MLKVRGAPVEFAPEIFAAELANWIERGKLPRDALLAAILRNDLAHTIAITGSNWPLVHATQVWLWNFAPPDCFGSGWAVWSWQHHRAWNHDA